MQFWAVASIGLLGYSIGGNMSILKQSNLWFYIMRIKLQNPIFIGIFNSNNLKFQNIGLMQNLVTYLCNYSECLDFVSVRGIFNGPRRPENVSI